MVPEFLQMPDECSLDSFRFAGEALIVKVAEEPVTDARPGKTRQGAASGCEIATRFALEGPRLGFGESVEERDDPWEESCDEMRTPAGVSPDETLNRPAT